MFATINAVNQLTGYDVSNETIHMAQAIIESHIGRVESDVQDATDRMLLERATAYQAAYMSSEGDGAKVFEQVSALQIMQFGQMVTFNNDGVSPWIAPLAVIACKGLSWKRQRSIKTGSIWDSGPSTYDWRRD